MTHEYTLLTGGRILDGRETVAAATGPQASGPTAIAWAGDTVLAIGTDAEVRAISRGDSHFVALDGATVIPVSETGEPTWPSRATLEVGGRADLAILPEDPRHGPSTPIAVVRGGVVVAGALPGPG